MGRGQPRLDIALRARNWIWYWMVRRESGLTDSELEARYAKSRDNPSESLPTFTRVRTMGTSPQDTRGFRKSGSIYDAVHCQENREAGKFEAARRAFESPFWEMLTTPNPSLARLQEIIESISTKRGLTRIRDYEIHILNGVISNEQLLKDVGIKIGDEHAIHELLKIQDLDTTALLAALYHEAIRNFRLDRALLLQDYVALPITMFLSTFQPEDPVFELAFMLVSDRILSDYWVTELDWYEATGRTPPRSGSEDSRIKEINGFLAWYTANPRNLPKKKSPGLGIPAAPPPALLWFRKNSDELISLQKKIEWGQTFVSPADAEASQVQDEITNIRRLVEAKLRQFDPGDQR